jgi:hypothetical protein
MFIPLQLDSRWNIARFLVIDKHGGKVVKVVGKRLRAAYNALECCKNVWFL